MQPRSVLNADDRAKRFEKLRMKKENIKEKLLVASTTSDLLTNLKDDVVTRYTDDPSVRRYSPKHYSEVHSQSSSHNRFEINLDSDSRYGYKKMHLKIPKKTTVYNSCTL